MPTITTKTMTLEKAECKSVLAPVPSKMAHLESPTHGGMPLKKLEAMAPVP